MTIRTNYVNKVIFGSFKIPASTICPFQLVQNCTTCLSILCGKFINVTYTTMTFNRYLLHSSHFKVFLLCINFFIVLLLLTSCSALFLYGNNHALFVSPPPPNLISCSTFLLFSHG